MKRWSIGLCAVLFAASCTTTDGPGTEAPGGGVGGVGAGGVGGSAGAGAGNAGEGDAGNGSGAGGVSGAAGQAGVGVGGFAGEGGAGGIAGDVASGTGGTGGSVPSTDEDGGTDDEGYCTTACTGAAPDENVVEACAALTAMDECVLFDTLGFPASCRWVTPDSEPCLAP